MSFDLVPLAIKTTTKATTKTIIHITTKTNMVWTSTRLFIVALLICGNYILLVSSSASLFAGQHGSASLERLQLHFSPFTSHWMPYHCHYVAFAYIIDFITIKALLIETCLIPDRCNVFILMWPVMRELLLKNCQHECVKSVENVN